MARDARVLVVDGDEQIRALLHKSLSDRGVAGEHVASSQEALAELAGHPYSLVLLQLEIDGSKDVLEWARSLPVQQRPIVIMTAERGAQKDDLDTDLVQIIIRRPLRVGEVAGLIRACLDAVPPAGGDRERTQ
jgi:DNA-binding response OmpR family regulator